MRQLSSLGVMLPGVREFVPVPLFRFCWSSALDAFAPDLLITDVGLPGGMNGRQVADAVRAVWDDLPVLFITGFAAVTLKAGKTMPQARVLSKPFHLRDLVLEVDRMFELERASDNI